VQSCFPSRELESAIDPLVYPMGAWEPLHPPFGPSGLEYPSESDLVVCRSSSPCACDSSLIDSVNPGQNLHHHMEYGQFTSPFGTVDPHLCDFSNFEFPSDEAILKAMLRTKYQYSIENPQKSIQRLEKETISDNKPLRGGNLLLPHLNVQVQDDSK
jgi:hypothetical protein